MMVASPTEGSRGRKPVRPTKATGALDARSNRYIQTKRRAPDLSGTRMDRKPRCGGARMGEWEKQLPDVEIGPNSLGGTSYRSDRAHSERLTDVGMATLAHGWNEGRPIFLAGQVEPPLLETVLLDRRHLSQEKGRQDGHSDGRLQTTTKIVPNGRGSTVFQVLSRPHGHGHRDASRLCFSTG
jgi:hypothetical protein